MRAHAWQVTRDGEHVATVKGSRRDAVTAACNPVLGMHVDTYAKLERADHAIAGWATIAADGWRIAPAEPVGC